MDQKIPAPDSEGELPDHLNPLHRGTREGFTDPKIGGDSRNRLRSVCATHRSVQPTGLCNQSVCAWEWVGTEDDSRRQLRKRCRDASNPMSPQVPGFPGHGPLPGAHDERQGNLANRPRTFRSGRSTPAVGLPAPDMSHATSLSQQVRATTVAQTPRAADSAPTSSLTMSDSSAHAALLTPQFSAAFPRFLHTHAETPTPSSRLTGKLVRN